MNQPRIEVGRGTPRSGMALVVLLLTVAVAGVYWNCRNAPFIFDDFPAVVRNQTIRDLTNLGEVLHPPLEGAGVTGRPLVNLSYAVNYALDGLAVPGYHLGSVLLHALATLALFGVLRRTFLLPGLEAEWGQGANWRAGGIALVWAVHPLLTESVVCIAQRNEVLAGLFYFLTFYGLVRAVEEGARHPHRWLLASVAACWLGMTSKEIMATAPLLALLYDRTFVAGSWGEAWRRRKYYHAALMAGWLLLAWLMMQTKQRAGIVGFGLGMGPWDYLVTQSHALVLYLKLSVWPHPLVVDYGPVTFTLGQVWPEATAIVALLLATLWALWCRPRIGFLGAWFFVILAPSSSFVPLTTQTMAEHRMYLPLVAVVTLLGLLLRRLPGRGAGWVAAGLALLLGAATIQRVAVYNDEEGFWRDLTKQQPANARAFASLANYYVRQERWAEALAPYEQALKLRPDYADAQSDYAGVLGRVGRLPEAISHYEEAVRLKPGDPVIQYNLGLALIQAGRPGEARANLEAVEAHDADRTGAALHVNLGNLLLDSGELTKAAAEYARALAQEPGSSEAHHNLALTLVRLGRPAEAVPHYETVLRQRPGSAQVHANLAIALELCGRVAKAVAQDEEALRLDPGLKAAREHLARLQR